MNTLRTTSRPRAQLFKALLVAAAAALLLAACTKPSEDPNTPAGGPGTLAPGAEWKDSLDISGLSSRDLVVIELDRDVLLEVYDQTGSNLLAWSDTRDYFSGPDVDLVGLDSLDLQAADPTMVCRGSCVVLRPGGVLYYNIRVVNDSGVRQNVKMFYYGSDFADTNEPNDDAATAQSIAVDGYGTGHIEYLGDEDWWKVQGSGELEVVVGSTAAPLDIRARVVSGSTVYGPYRGAFPVTNGDYVVVYAHQDRAAVAAKSRYTLIGPE